MNPNTNLSHLSAARTLALIIQFHLDAIADIVIIKSKSLRDDQHQSESSGTPNAFHGGLFGVVAKMAVARGSGRRRRRARERARGSAGFSPRPFLPSPFLSPFNLSSIYQKRRMRDKRDKALVRDRQFMVATLHCHTAGPPHHVSVSGYWRTSKVATPQQAAPQKAQQ